MINAVAPIGDAIQDPEPSTTQEPLGAVVPEVLEAVVPERQGAVILSPSKEDSQPPQKPTLNVLPPLSQTQNQATQSSTPLAYLQPVPGAAPPPNSPSPIPAPFSDTPTPSYPSTSDSSTVSKKTMLGYFLLGFLLNLLFFIPVILWLAFKSKNGTKKKFLAYIAGLISALVVSSTLTNILTPFFTEKLTETIPSLGYVPQRLSSVYPDIEFGASVYYEKDITNGAEISTSSLTVTTSSTTPLDPNMVKQIGILACDAIADHNETFDRVVVSQLEKKKVLFFTVDTFVTVDQTCVEWYGGPPPDPMNFPSLE